MSSLEGKTAIVTGGTRGIGRAITEKLVAQRAMVAVLSRSPYTGESQENVSYYTCDVGDFTSAQETVTQIIKDLGAVDILVNNAGITKDNLILKMSSEDFDAVINANLKGTFNMIKSCYSHFAKRRSGRIINISSVSALLGTKGQANYVSSKEGIIGLTKVTARELGARGVTCNAIAPGFIETEMTAVLSDDLKAQYAAQIPMGKYGSTDDVANLVAFLASDESSYITGQTISVDGGLAIGC